MPEIVFPATPTQRAFIESKAYLNFLMGPRGEGKTSSGLFATFAHALEHDALQWPIRWAVIRDTWENLKTTTLPSIRLQVQKYRIPAQGLDKLEPKEVRLGSHSPNGMFRPLVELHFFGLDQPQDANRLQGFEAAGAWIEEPAPAADLASGVPEDALLAVTSLRQGGANVRPRVQITFNPPDETHWTVKYRDDPDTIAELKERGIEVAFFEIPPGENPGITKEYRQRNEAMLIAMGRPDLVARLVYGKVGYVQMGEAVTPEFNDEIHAAKSSLPILRRAPIIRGWDFGLNPTTVWFQITPKPFTRINIFQSIRGEHMGCEQHIEANVIPWQVKVGINSGYYFEDIGDPNGMNPEEKNSNVSAVTAIEEMLNAGPNRPASFEPGPIPIPERVGPIRVLLRRLNEKGYPIIQIDQEAHALKRALGGGWHRKKSPAGIIGDIVKDEHSEHGDALGYALGVKFPIPKLIERPKSKRLPRPSRLVAVGHGQEWMAT